MIGTFDEIYRRLRAGEDGQTEFMEVVLDGGTVGTPHSEEMARNLVAFSNADGGTLFLGVDDEGTPVGLQAGDLPIVEQWLVNIATNNCDPRIRPGIRRLALEGPSGATIHLLMVTVSRGLYVHRNLSGRRLVRVGSTQQDLSRFIQEQRRTYAFDESPVYGASLADLDEEGIQRVFEARPSVPWETLLQNLRILAEDDEGSRRPTVAGLLTFGHEPREYLPGAEIHAAVYRGVTADSDELVHSATLGGPVPRQIESAVSFVDRFMLRGARKDVGREELPQFRLGSVMEAIVNATAHRDYSVAGSRIRLFLFRDRLEIMSPGGLPNSLTLDTMPFRQFTRNQLLVSFLSRMRTREGRYFIEQRGEGVSRILRESREHSGTDPEYTLQGNELHLRIWSPLKSSGHDSGAEDLGDPGLGQIP